MDYVTVHYGGTTDYSTDYPMLMLYSSSNTLSNSTISDSEYHTIGTSANPTISDSTISDGANNRDAVYMSSGSPTLSNNTFTDNTYGVYISGTATPTLTSNTFTDNGYPIYSSGLNTGTTFSGNTGSNNYVNGIFVTGSSTGDITFNMDNDLLYVPYVFSVSSGGTLTVDPGTIVKFYQSSVNYFLVSGTLDAQGTTADPIVFTSYYDDTYGEDTDGTGSTTTAVTGDWDYISIGGTATVTNAIDGIDFLKYGDDY